MDKLEKECQLEVSVKEKQVCSLLQSNMYSFSFEINLVVSLIFELSFGFVTDRSNENHYFKSA